MTRRNPVALSDYSNYCEDVARAYDAAPQIDPNEIWRWEKLADHTDRFYRRMRREVDVVFVDGQPYESAEQMRREVKRTGKLYVSCDFNTHPVFSPQENLRFRAVHDYIVHIKPGDKAADFSQRGEMRAYNLHRRLAPPDTWPALFTEVAAQACYATARGEFPVQKIAVLPFDYYDVGSEYAANPRGGSSMGNFEAGFALGDYFGPEYFLEGAELDDALGEAERLYPKHTPIMFDGDLYTVGQEGGEDFTPNRRGQSLVAVAHERSGLGTFYADTVMAMTADEAHQRLLPFFKMRIKSGAHKGKIVKAYDTAAKMKKIFLTANAKLMKAKKGLAGVPPGISRGPNLLPHALVGELTKKRRLSLLETNKRLNFCVGSNKACRSTCLVYSGNNPVADKQVPAKLARSEALLREPVAWLRMFAEAINWHVDYCNKKGLVPYVRPNVLSDIPWELVFPDMFELFPDLWFYDYTKVPGRSAPRRNYDLTFSFSGTNGIATEHELSRGHRIAVVFWLQKPCSRYQHPCDSPSELTFLGQRVIDGDPHDFRPLDPPGSVIGLSYKIPTVKGKRFAKPPEGADKFVIPTFRDKDTGALLVAGTPAQLGAEEVFEHAAPSELEVA